MPFHNRRILATQMGLAEQSISMIECDVGGGFGVRGEFYPEDFLIPFAARRLGRPVKWVEDRREHLSASNHARDAECELEIACERDGTILGLRGRAAVDIGAYIRTNGATAARNIVQILSGPYRIPHIHVGIDLLVSNKTPTGTYRGPGRFEADFFRERLFDMAAGDLELDRVEFRRHNLIAETEMPYTLARVAPLDAGSEADSGDYRATLDRCIAAFDWRERSALQGRLIDGRYHGLGIGCYFEGGGSGPRENARLELERDGSVSVYVGSSSVGQGVETVLAQIAADALDLPIGRHPRRLSRLDQLSAGRLRLLQFALDRHGRLGDRGGGSELEGQDSRGGGQAARLCRAGGRARRRQGGRARRPSPDRLAAILPRTVSRRTAPMRATGGPTATARMPRMSSVDPKTGHVAVLDYLAVEDVGRIINPLTLHGQTVGAVVQGLGGALLEHIIYDENGQLLTGSLADYLMPSASDFPHIRAMAFEERPAPHNPLGAKGAGEGGIIPVGGVIANAVADALAPFGVEPRDLPLSPPRLWQLIVAAKARGASR